MKGLSERRCLHMGCGEPLWHRSIDRFGIQVGPLLTPTPGPVQPPHEQPLPTDAPSAPVIDPGRRE